MRKRNKQEHRCIESCKAYDNWVMKFSKNNIKCNIPYLQLDKELPVCNSKEQIKRGMIIEGIAERNNLIKPCKTMEMVRMQYVESTVDDEKEQFWFSISFPKNRFKEIIQTRFDMNLK